MSALLLVRTPFQAWLAQKVLEKECIKSFDIVYFTQNNSEEDRYYFEQLSSISDNSEYIFVTPQRFDILSHIIFRLKARKWYSLKKYNHVIYASINALVPNSLISKHNSSELITFDDGAANVVNSGIFHDEDNNIRVAIYRTLLRSRPLKEIKKRIVRHYTLYPNNANIVEREKLVFLESWENNQKISSIKTKTYFIGSPFEEVMNPNQVIRMKGYVKSLDIDAYVTHPRENNALDIGVPILSKSGRIAEDAIISDAGDRPIRLVGWFSTVMLNLGAVCESRIVLLPKDSPKTPELFELSKKAGCTPILI